jgi:hypothetical protein
MTNDKYDKYKNILRINVCQVKFDLKHVIGRTIKVVIPWENSKKNGKMEPRV